MRIGRDSVIEPDPEPRNTRFHMKIAQAEKIAGLRLAYNVTLECGHGVQVFGDLAHAQGVILCTKCRDMEEP